MEQVVEQQVVVVMTKVVEEVEQDYMVKVVMVLVELEMVDVVQVVQGQILQLHLVLIIM